MRGRRTARTRPRRRPHAIDAESCDAARRPVRRRRRRPRPTHPRRRAARPTARRRGPRPARRPAARQRPRPEDGLAHRVHRVQHAERGDRRRVARTADGGRDARDPRRLERDAVHVGLRRVHVFGRDVPAAEFVDGRPECAQERLRSRRARVVEQHDRLATALVEPCHRRLEAHRLRQPQHVDERVALRRVVPEPDAAERRAERGRVDGDDAA